MHVLLASLKTKYSLLIYNSDSVSSRSNRSEINQALIEHPQFNIFKSRGDVLIEPSEEILSKPTPITDDDIASSVKIYRAKNRDE